MSIAEVSSGTVRIHPPVTNDRADRPSTRGIDVKAGKNRSHLEIQARESQDNERSWSS